MATIASNVLVKGFRGKLGDSLVFKTMRGKTFVNVPASKPNKKKESTAQRGTRVTFKQASEWAQVILLNPQQKAYYQQRAKKLKLPNAYTAALTDYMRKPTLKTFPSYDNSTMCWISKKDFELNAVTVIFHNAANAITETRTIAKSSQGDFRFKLTEDDLKNCIEIFVTGAANTSKVLKF